MELKFLIFLFFILPYIICYLGIPKKEPKKFAKEVEQIEKYYAETEIVEGILKLNKLGFLGEGNYAFVYAGKFIEKDLSEVPVAIKFFPKNSTIPAGIEFEMYEELDAYQNPRAEEFGIPNVYYHGEWGFLHYGEWNSYTLTAMTKLDHSLADIQDQEKNLKIQIIYPIDMMILFRHFVIQSEYMYDHRISHGFVNANNLMFRFNQSFVTDFNNSSMISIDQETVKPTHDEWKHFIYTVMEHYGIGSEKSWAAYKPKVIKRKLDEDLLEVIIKFGDEAFQDVKDSPDYKTVGKFIDIKIDEMRGGYSKVRPTFSWLY